MISSVAPARRSAAALPVRRGPAPLPSRERLLLSLVCAHLCFLPWALGDMHEWSQFASLACSSASMGVALFSWHTSLEPRTPRLSSQPIFWIGVALLAYVFIQAVNPAWSYKRDGSSWWLVGVKHVVWLPSGMDTPFSMANPWRYLVIYSSAWMTACAISVGFTRGRTVRIFFIALACNAFLLALLGLLERCTGADEILWHWRPPAYYFVSTFIYKNHAGAYFNIMLGICLGLATLYQERGRRLLEKSSPSMLFAFFGVIVALVIVFSYSRAATILMLCYLPVVSALFAVSHLGLVKRSENAWRKILPVCAVTTGFCMLALLVLPTGQAMEKMEALVSGGRSDAPDFRRAATRATLEMARSEPIFGWGAGSFRFEFPNFQRANVSILKDTQGNTLFWEHAHNDYAELLSELGLAGMALISVGALGYALSLVRLRFWENRAAAVIVGGCLLTLVHSYGDFNFYNPAILVTWCACLTAIRRLLETDEPGRRLAATDAGHRRNFAMAGQVQK
jgi:O-antigen ligase